MLSSSDLGFKTLRDMQMMKETEEIKQFCCMLDRYDMMNTRALYEGLRQRKPYLKA